MSISDDIMGIPSFCKSLKILDNQIHFLNLNQVENLREKKVYMSKNLISKCICSKSRIQHVELETS